VKNPVDPRRLFLRSASRFLEPPDDRQPADSEVPRLTHKALERIPPMSRSREKILSNLDEMYREAFERAQTTGDEGQMATLDFAYRREQLYFEILLDIRDAMERRQD
jgi:hypothetical protein